MANDEMTTLSVAETDNDPQKNAQALERLLQSMFDASNLKTVESTLSQIRRRRARGTSGLWPSSP